MIHGLSARNKDHMALFQSVPGGDGNQTGLTRADTDSKEHSRTAFGVRRSAFGVRSHHDCPPNPQESHTLRIDLESGFPSIWNSRTETSSTCLSRQEI